MTTRAWPAHDSWRSGGVDPALLGAIVDSANTAIIGVDADDRIVSWNRAATELYGWSEAEVLGRKPDFLAPQRYVGLHDVTHTETLGEGREHSLETTRRRKDGGEVVIAIQAFPIRDADGRIVGGASISRDISAERAVRKALEESEARYRVLFETMSDGVVLQNSRGEVISFNQRALAILHVSEDELRGTTGRDPRWQPIYQDGRPCPPDQRPAAVALRTGQPVADVILGLPLPDGHEAWVLVNATPLFDSGDGDPTGVVVTFADFTGRKAAFDALRESEERFRMALSTIETGVFIFDGERLTFVNEALCAMVGYSRDELLTMERRDFESIVNPDDLQRALEISAGLLAGEESSPPLEVQATRRDGGLAVFEMKATVLPGAAGRQVLVAVHDLTERAAMTRLKDELLGMVSHELRTPLTTLVGNAQVLGREDRLVPPLVKDELVDDIKRDAERLEQVLSNMMVLSKSESAPPPMEPVLLQRVIPDVIEEQHRRVPQAFQVRVDDDLPPVLAEPGYVRQVLINLFSNAAKYAGLARPVELEVQRAGEEAVVSVSDRGPGFDPATVTKLFEPFYRSDSSSRRIPGMGLGLTVCRRLVEIQGGRMTASNREGGGASFTFTLPLVHTSDTDAKPGGAPGLTGEKRLTGPRN